MVISSDIIDRLLLSETIPLYVFLERTDVPFGVALSELEYLEKNHVIIETEEDMFTVTHNRRIIDRIRKEAGYWYYPHKAEDFRENWGTVLSGAAKELLKKADARGGLSESEMLKADCSLRIVEALISSGLLVKCENKYYSTIRSEHIGILYGECKKRASLKAYGYSAKDDDKNIRIFGSYPQSRVEDGKIISALNRLAESLPDKNGNNGWISQRPIINRSTTLEDEEDFMWYKDVEYKGSMYRGLYFTSYIHIFGHDSETPAQKEIGYLTNTVYWFNFEPIEWRILKKEDDMEFLVSRHILDARYFQRSYIKMDKELFNDSKYAPEGTPANSWEYSDLRLWLNDTFKCTAFSAQEIKKIHNLPVVTVSGSKEFNFTMDKVFILSLDDVTSSTTGFASEKETEDISRQFESTDYARAHGNLCNDWWLRSPLDRSNGFFEYCVCGPGNIFKVPVTLPGIGVLPVIIIKTKQ